MLLLSNFQIMPEEEFSISYTNRSFQYNDGLFDTLIMEQGEIRFLPDHLERMHQAMHLLQLIIPDELLLPEVFRKKVQELASLSNLQTRYIRIKIYIWRKAGGLFTPEQNTAETLITVQEQVSYNNLLNKVDFASTVRNSYSPLSFFKGPFAAHYVLASLEKKQRQMEELFLLDKEGNVSEALTANIFWIKENVLYTPSLNTGCIAGIIRKNILKVCKEEQLSVEEGLFQPAQLQAAECIFICNVTGIRLINFLKESEYSTFHPTIQLFTKKLFHTSG